MNSIDIFEILDRPYDPETILVQSVMGWNCEIIWDDDDEACEDAGLEICEAEDAIPLQVSYVIVHFHFGQNHYYDEFGNFRYQPEKKIDDEIMLVMTVDAGGYYTEYMGHNNSRLSVLELETNYPIAYQRLFCEAKNAAERNNAMDEYHRAADECSRHWKEVHPNYGRYENSGGTDE